MSTKCIGLLGRFLGHQYQARYSTKETPNDINMSDTQVMYTGKKLWKIMRPLLDATYIADICVHCGDIKHYDGGR